MVRYDDVVRYDKDMTGITKKKTLKTICFASVLLAMTAACPAHAQESLRPEVEIDGSVLQHLSQFPSASGLERNLAPVHLRPPETISPEELEMMEPAAGDTTTADLSTEDDTPPAPIPSPRPAIKKKSHIPVKSVAVTAPVPSRKPGNISKPVTDAAKLPEPSPVIQSLREEKINAEERKQIIAAPTIPSQDIQKILEQAKPAPDTAAENRPILSPPVILRPPEDAPVFFAVTEKTRTGGLNPENSKTDLATPDTPPVIMAAIDPSLSIDTAASPLTPINTEMETPKDYAWQQKNPIVLYKDIPIPAKRPAIQTASQEFVREARRTYLDTYTIKRHDGDTMPAVPKGHVKAEELPSRRLSVADIEGDPLASRIVNMTPEEVAIALNNIAPASGRSATHMAHELNAVSKPRIIRQEGEWIRKTKPAEKEETVAQENQTAENTKPEIKETDAKITVAKTRTQPATNPVRPGVTEILFPSGKADLDDSLSGIVDNSVIPALKETPDARIQIVAWASPTDGKESTARRLSLSRALSIRSLLISRGIDATRMDVRAMGIQQDSQAAADKVDLMLLVPEKI